ncbi:MAG: (2Fe-2S)-binding protein [Thaumarchaeota archaeon]|nr:(2Fe-2S)-binding protein [Nitrososphaerota archaeon]
MNLEINGALQEVEVSVSTSLADMLRETLGMTGTKRGCDSGGCGMCSVILNGLIVYSCMTPAWKAEGGKLETVEGLERKGKLHQLQDTFVRNSASQCGYCTPGILMAAKALIDSNPHPTEDEIREALCGVLCRCTGYVPYLKSIREVAVQSAIR